MGKFLDENGVSKLMTKMKGVVTQKASGTTSLTAAAGQYYDIAGTVNTLTVTLPAVTATTHMETIILHFTTGTTPNVTLTASEGKTISYFADYAIEASTEYEINIIWNGTKWVVAFATIE